MWKLSQKSKLYSNDPDGNNDYLNRSARRLEKLPTHVAFAISEDPISLPDVANLVVWAFDAGVSCVSLYDREGRIKSEKLELLRAFVDAAEVQSTSLVASRDEFDLRSHCQNNEKDTAWRRGNLYVASYE